MREADTEGHTGCDSTDGKRPEQAGLWCPEYLTGTVSNLEDEKVPGRWGTGEERLHNGVNILNVTELCT